jgi:hypothetical protein
MTAMRVRFIRGTALGGEGNDAHPGDVRDLPEAQARHCVALGRAEPVADPAPAPAPAAAPTTAPAPATTPRTRARSQ